MSWFDTAGIANFAKSALTTAQKTIDKALDIKEETEIKKDKVPKAAESDNFFEAFGLGDKPSSSQPEIRPSQNVLSELQMQQVSAQGSGFWTDTWGSFFEMKSHPSTKPDSRKENLNLDNKPSDGPARKDNAVLSQPHRASLFPSDSSQTFVQDSTIGDNSIVSEISVVESTVLDDGKRPYKECLLKNENAITSTKGEGNEDNIVTLQPLKETLPPAKLGDDLFLSVVETCSRQSDIKTQINERECDKTDVTSESTNPKELENVPMPDIIPRDSENKPVDESQYLSIHMPLDSCNIGQKVESEYDVIEMSESDVSNNIMENSNDSFTRSASVEVVTSMSQCSVTYDISSSTLEIPDLPENMAENLHSWEWSAIENISPDLYVTQSESIDFDNSDSSQSIQMLSSDSSYHTITASSFNDNHLWVKSEKSSHFVDESQNSSNEEQNSHHSDGSSNSSKDDDDTDTAEVKEYDAKSSSSNASQATSSSSFVKCSADDNDNSSHRGPSPISTTASERSDVTKHESEQNTSGDENETATSSDIEILSPPNGENGDRNSSPLKHIWLPRPLRLRRSESPTSDSSKDSLMPVVSELEEVSSSGDKTSMLYTKDESLPHKIFSEDSSLAKLLQKQEELQTVLDSREKKILELSKENVELQENEQRLKNLVQKMRVEQAKESRDIAALTKEFTQRLSLVENQLRETIQERDRLQNELEEAKNEIAKRICASDMEDVIKEKDIQIKELTEEGQKLSKKELQHTTIIKKLRAKEDEMDKTIKSQAEKLEENSKEVERLRKSIGAKEEQEKKHIDAIRQLSNTVKKLEKEVATLKSNLEDSTEKELSLKKSLDSTYKDLTDLKKSYTSKERELEDLKSGLEIEANENLRQMLENAHKEAAKEKEMLLLQIQELRCTISRSEEEANLREKMYKADIASLQKRLQEAEERNEDLTKNVSSATRPLVRQIENLQATYNAQTISWEKIEKNLTDRLTDAQNQLALMYEKERSATEKYMEYQSKVTGYETQNNTLRQEKLQLLSEVETFKAQIIMLEENKSRESYTLQKLKDNFNSEMGKLKKEKAELEKTMATCLEQLDCEKKKVSKLEEELKFKEARAIIMSNVSRSSSPTGSVRSSVSSIHNWSQDEDHGSSTPVNSYRMSVYESLRLGSGSSLLENLQSQLKQREGEIIQLQSEIAKLEQVKESMTQELVLLSEQNEKQEMKLNKLESVEKEYKDLDQKYNTLLQMYGEKVEETEELQLDLADVKTMYKAQIEELLRNK